MKSTASAFVVSPHTQKLWQRHTEPSSLQPGSNTSSEEVSSQPSQSRSRSKPRCWETRRLMLRSLAQSVRAYSKQAGAACWLKVREEGTLASKSHSNRADWTKCTEVNGMWINNSFIFMKTRVQAGDDWRRAADTETSLILNRGSFHSQESAAPSATAICVSVS